jgi:hypothetical protein
MRQTLAFLLALVLMSCGGMRPPGQKGMSFSHMQSINPGVSGEWVLSEFPGARNIRRRPDGTLQSVGYWVTDPEGKSRPVVMHMDQRGVLRQKQYGGPIVRPPKSDGP